MAEYIEREKVYKMLHVLGGCSADPAGSADDWDRAIDAAIEGVDDIPAADVHPERNGVWRRRDGKYKSFLLEMRREDGRKGR